MFIKTKLIGIITRIRKYTLIFVFVDNFSEEEINIHPITKVNEQHEEDSTENRDHKSLQ